MIAYPSESPVPSASLFSVGIDGPAQTAYNLPSPFGNASCGSSDTMTPTGTACATIYSTSSKCSSPECMGCPCCVCELENCPGCDLCGRDVDSASSTTAQSGAEHLQH